MSAVKKTFLETLDEKSKKFLESINAARIAFNKTKMAAAATDTTKEAKTADGKVLKYTGDTLAVGSTCTLVTDSGEVPAPDGDLTLEDGTVVTIKDGKVGGVETKAVEDSEAKMKKEKKALEDLITKFAAGTPEERIANLEIMCKALMNYNFSYDLSQGVKDSALAAYTALSKEKGFLTIAEGKEIAKAHNASLTKVKELEVALNKQTEFNLELAETVAQFMALPTDTPIDAGKGGGGEAGDFKELTEDEYKNLSSFKKHKYDKALREHKFTVKK